MTTHLVVVRPFGGLARGDLVSDPAHISSILASENAAHVVRVVATASSDAKQEG